MIELDPPALARGVAVAAVVCVPSALVGLWASNRDDLGWLGGLAVLGVIAGLIAGGAVAAHRQQVGSPLTHGILAAAALFVIVQGVGLVLRALGDGDVRWSRVLSSAVLTLIAGAIGGIIGGRAGARPKAGGTA